MFVASRTSSWVNARQYRHSPPHNVRGAVANLSAILYANGLPRRMMQSSHGSAFQVFSHTNPHAITIQEMRSCNLQFAAFMWAARLSRTLVPFYSISQAGSSSEQIAGISGRTRNHFRGLVWWLERAALWVGDLERRRILARSMGCALQACRRRRGRGRIGRR
jgi:hypothetical protein